MTGNNKKIKFVILCVPILFLLGLGLSVHGLHYDEIGILKANWDINMPQPLKVIDVASNRVSLGGDGTAYHVLEYSDETIHELKKLNYWSGSDKIISDRITDLLIDLEKSTEVPNENKELMKKYPPKINDSCLYYYKDKGNHHFLIMMLDVSNKRVYVLESYR